jgi:hypothetical protein
MALAQLGINVGQNPNHTTAGHSLHIFWPVVTRV